MSANAQSAARRLRIRVICSGALLLSALALGGCTTTGEPQPNLSLYKQRLIQYHASGEYLQGIARRVVPAKAYLAKRSAEAARSREKIAVVLDIDETSLSNWPLLVRDQFANLPEDFAAWVRRGNPQAIQPTLELFRQARAANVPVFLITGRREPLRSGTIRDLRQAGYEGWTELILRPVADRAPSVVPYKSGARQAIEAKGFRIVVNIGDQWSDLRGGFAERTYKLPDPFYYIP